VNLGVGKSWAVNLKRDACVGRFRRLGAAKTD
jgi:hypothetical protein